MPSGGPARSTGDLITAGLFLLAGSGAAAGGLHLRLGAVHEPQAGFFPFVGGVLLVGLSALLLVKALLGRSAGTERFGRLAGPAVTAAGLVLYVAALAPLGYVPATFALSLLLLRVLGVRRLGASAVASLVVAAGTYALFKGLLGIPLPPGLLPLGL